MPGKKENSRKRSEKATRKTRPPGKRRNCVKATNVGLRRSKRQTSNAFASSRITTNRLTLPLTFLDKGIKSETVSCKKENNVVINESNKHILNEDLLSLLPSARVRNQSDDCGGPTNRRITRSLNTHFTDVSSYYLSCFSNQAICSESTKNSTFISNDDTLVDSKSVDVQVDVLDEVRENLTEVPDLTINTSTLHNTINDRIRPVNHKFCHNVFEQLKIKLRGSKRFCILKLKESIEKINDMLDGKCTPASAPKPKIPAKRPSEEDGDRCINVPLVPQSQWVYSTPDKQNIKKFVFEEGGSDKFHPAVMRTSKNSKVLYDIKNEVMQHINLNKFRSGQDVTIDQRYLETICETAIDVEEEAMPNPSKKQRLDRFSGKENVFPFLAPASKTDDFVLQPRASCSRGELNMFLSGAAEESIDLHNEIGSDDAKLDLSFEARPIEATIKKDLAELNERYGNFDFRQCKSALPKESLYYVDDPYAKAPKDYHQQLLLATQRPCKTNRKIQKRHLLKAKSLSFDNTPPGTKAAVAEPKRLDLLRKMEEAAYFDEFEKQFSKPSRDTSGIPHTLTSGALNENMGSVEVADVEMEEPVTVPSLMETLEPAFKYYPRRNYDPQ